MDILGGKVGSLPAVYLGMAESANRRSMDIWKGVLEKSEKKTYYMKSKYLSTAEG